MRQMGQGAELSSWPLAATDQTCPRPRPLPEPATTCHARAPRPRAETVARRAGPSDRGDDFDRRGHQAHRFGPVHHRVAADLGRRPAVERRRLAGGFRRLSENPRIYRAQARHEPRRIQDHLLVGMGASFSRPADRRRVLRAVRGVLDRRLYSARTAAAARLPVPARRVSGRGRLVHGEKRSGRAHRCQPVPARRAFRHRARHSRLHPLAPVRPRPAVGEQTLKQRRLGCEVRCWR